MFQETSYNGRTYQLNEEQAQELGTELEELDFYGFEETEQKTAWIVYKFLKSKGYNIRAPRFPEPFLITDDLYDMGRSEGAAFEVQQKVIRPVYNSLREKEDEEANARRGGLIVALVILGLLLLFKACTGL